MKNLLLLLIAVSLLSCQTEELENNDLKANDFDKEMLMLTKKKAEAAIKGVDLDLSKTFSVMEGCEYSGVNENNQAIEVRIYWNPFSQEFRKIVTTWSGSSVNSGSFYLAPSVAISDYSADYLCNQSLNY